jgi:hypothetical protein
MEGTDRKNRLSDKLYSVATVGGDLDFIMDLDCDSCDLSPDGKAFAALVAWQEPWGHIQRCRLRPSGSPLRPTRPRPSRARKSLTTPQLRLFARREKILLFRAGENRKRSLAAAVSRRQQAPHRILQKLPTLQGVPTFSWMPDSRHIVVALTAMDAILPRTPLDGGHRIQ